MSTRKTSTISKPRSAKVLFTVPEGRDFHREAALTVSCTLTNLSPGHFGPPLPRLSYSASRNCISSTEIRSWPSPLKALWIMSFWMHPFAGGCWNATRRCGCTFSCCRCPVDTALRTLFSSQQHSRAGIQSLTSLCAHLAPTACSGVQRHKNTGKAQPSTSEKNFH